MPVPHNSAEKSPFHRVKPPEPAISILLLLYGRRMNMANAIQTADDLLLPTTLAAIYLGRDPGNLAVWRNRGIGPAYRALLAPGTRRRVIFYAQSDLDKFNGAEERREGRLPRPYSGYARGKYTRTGSGPGSKVIPIDPAKKPR
jgi:hypothetical protein